MSETRVCHFCGATVGSGEPCVVCVESWPNRPDPEAMTGEERGEELRQLFGTLEVPFPMVHERIESLVGRPVWTHEMGLNAEGLIREAASRKHPTMDEVIDLIPAEKRIVLRVDRGAE